MVSEGCATTASCFSTQSETGNCTIEYGQDPFFQNFSNSISDPLNSSLDLETSTLYYLQIKFMLNSDSVILRRNYTTGTSM